MPEIPRVHVGTALFRARLARGVPDCKPKPGTCLSCMWRKDRHSRISDIQPPFVDKLASGVPSLAPAEHFALLKTSAQLIVVGSSRKRHLASTAMGGCGSTVIDETGTPKKSVTGTDNKSKEVSYMDWCKPASTVHSRTMRVSSIMTVRVLYSE